jgi:hypothetical protein
MWCAGAQAAKQAQEAQHFLQNRPEPPPSPRGSHTQTLRPATADGMSPRPHRAVGEGVLARAGSGMEGRAGAAGVEVAPPLLRRKSTVEFFEGGRRASVTTFY